MLQRQQTVWLIIAVVFIILGFSFPFYSGTTYVRDHLVDGVDLLADRKISLFLFSIVTGITAFVALILYKKRKIQLRVTIAALLLSVLLLFFYFREIKDYEHGHILLTSLFTFALPVCFFMAARGIRHDEKLVKSLDKIR